MPEFPLRLQFTVEIDISGSKTPIGATTDTPSSVVIEVAVHNMKTPQAEDVIGKPRFALLLACQQCILERKWSTECASVKQS